MADDPNVSGRLRRFLATTARCTPAMTEAGIRSMAAVHVDGRSEPACEDLLAAMVAFERRYGGLTYPLIVGNAMQYGLDGDAAAYPTPHGVAFAGIVDGDWSWPVDVLPDGRTAMAPGTWPSRIIDRSVDQRLEKHALLAAVRRWPHRAYECFTPAGSPPAIREELFPPPVRSASGPADRWWFDDETAVQLTLHGWPPGHDHWIARIFARGDHLRDDVIRSAVHGGLAKPAGWCELCARGRPGAAYCFPG